MMGLRHTVISKRWSPAPNRYGSRGTVTSKTSRLKNWGQPAAIRRQVPLLPYSPYQQIPPRIPRTPHVYRRDSQTHLDTSWLAEYFPGNVLRKFALFPYPPTPRSNKIPSLRCSTIPWIRTPQPYSTVIYEITCDRLRKSSGTAFFRFFFRFFFYFII